MFIHTYSNNSTITLGVLDDVNDGDVLWVNNGLSDAITLGVLDAVNDERYLELTMHDKIGWIL